VTAEVIAIGSELTCGAKLDTNSQWISQELAVLGWTVTRHTTLSDSLDVIACAIRDAAARSRVVVITGGLGPTLDDITRDAMAAAFGQSLVHDEESMSQIEALFTARGREMPERNRRQAQRPEHAVALANSCGTAPGVLMNVPYADSHGAHAACIVAALPGVPDEMKQMFIEHVRPRLTSSGTIVERMLIQTFGMGESEVEQRLDDLTERGRNPEVGITASQAVITLSITARAASHDECSRTMLPVRDAICQRLGSAVFGVGEADLHECVSEKIRSSGLKIACIEGAATGGLIAHWLCDDALHDDYLLEARLRIGPSMRDILVMHTEPLTAWERLFREEAADILRSTEADYVLLTSAQWDSTAETGVSRRHAFVAVAGRELFKMQDVTMSGNLAIFRARAARTALNCLRLAAFEQRQRQG
jgi:competence/damage-inducible protein CinA-like protein